MKLAPPPPPSEPPSLRRNFGWSMSGNLVYQGSQWGMLVVLAKLTSPLVVGQFALALAVCTPVIMLANLQLRAVLVTDVDDDFDVGHFVALRLASVTLAVVIIAGVAWHSSSEALIFGVIFMVGVGKAVEAFGEVYLAFEQKHERMDLVAISQAIQGALTLLALATVTALTGSLFVAVAAMAAARLLGMLLWDLPMSARLGRQLDKRDRGTAMRFRPRWERTRLLQLAGLALPLGLTMFLITLNFNAPRYFIQTFIGSEALGYFAAIAALPLAGGLIVQSAGVSALPRLTRYFRENHPAYRRLMVRLLLLAVTLGAVGLAVVIPFGRLILDLTFTPDYAQHQTLFVWLMVFGAVTYVASFLGCGMTAAKRFRIQLPLFAVVLGATTCSGAFLVPRMGLVGGATSLIIGSLVHVGGGAWVILTALKGKSSAELSPTAPKDASPLHADLSVVSCQND